MSDAARGLLHGVLPIVSSPFTAGGALDLESLATLADFIVGAGAHGVVYPAIASEFATLTPDERKQGVDTVAEAIAGRLPFVVAISDEQPALSARHARHAEAVDAAAVMLMAPRSAGQSADAVVAFFQEALSGTTLPVILQNAPPPLGSSLTVETVRTICERVPQVTYVKEEVVPCGPRISALLEGVASLAGVFGGAGGRFVLDELTRGATGSMPACEATEYHVELYKAFRAGRHVEARRAFTTLLPLLNVGSAYRTPVTKHILVRRALIANAYHRDENPALDAVARAELDTIWTELTAYPATVAP